MVILCDNGNINSEISMGRLTYWYVCPFPLDCNIYMNYTLYRHNSILHYI